MNRNLTENENPNSNFNKSNTLDIPISISQKSQEKLPEIQVVQSQNETPLSTKGNVKSYCRIRPNYTIYSSLSKFNVENNNKTLCVDFTPYEDRGNPSKKNLVKYNFTEIFWTETTNKEIYQKICKENIDQFFSKHKNALIFVYGITNSGKTYTVNGNLDSPGILQLSLIDLVKEFQKLKENNNLWQLTCTYIEIYNEEIFDLLSKERKKLKISGTSNKFFPQGAIVKIIEDFPDFENVLKVGELNKSKGETNANPYSSRSHSIFRVELSYKGNSSQNKIYIEPVSLCIVDLAGAERVSKSGVSGAGLKEAGNINTSLLCLKKCFDAMEANSKTNCPEKKVIVPVRESKLTSLFKEYFAAHQNISIICTINPDINEMNDIKSVLNFGSHAMRVKTIKSWIKANNYSSRDISPNKNGSRNNSPMLKDLKRYRMYTNRKYLDKNYNYSKEKDSKCKEDSNSSNNSSFSKKKNIIYNSSEKINNIKLVKNKKIAQNISAINNILVKSLNDENCNNISNSSNNSLINIINNNYEERRKFTSNPFQILSKNNFSVEFMASKERKNLEQKIKEKQEEMKEKMTKKSEDLKNVFASFLKKIYYQNLNKNIEIYENQCKNIDLYEIETLLSKKNNCIHTFQNPFIKISEEDKKIYSKNLKICGDNDLIIPSNKSLSTNNNNNLIEELINIKYGDYEAHEHDQTRINDFLDKSLEQYQTTVFKAHFGIGESLIKKMEDEKKNKKIKEKEKIVVKFKSLNNDIEMADKIDNNNLFNDDIFENEFNFRQKRKYKNINQNKQNNDNQDMIRLNEEKEENIFIKLTNIDDEEKIEDKSDIEKNIKDKKKRKKSKKKEKKMKKYEFYDENNDKEREENDTKEKPKDNEEEVKNNNDEGEGEKERDISKKSKRNPKSKRSNKRKGSKKTEKSVDSNNETNEDEIPILATKNNKKRKKSKKKKFESDTEGENNSVNEENIYVKYPKIKRGKSKKK